MKINLDEIGTHDLKVCGEPFTVEIIDSTKDYVEMCKDIFDFPQIKDFLSGKSVLMNGMNGGNYLFILILDLDMNFNSSVPQFWASLASISADKFLIML